MVSSGTEEHSATSAQPQVQAQPTQAVAGASATEERIPTSKTIEMTDLPTAAGASLSTPEATPTVAQPQTTTTQIAPVVASEPAQQTTTTNPAHPDLNRSQTAELALGPDGEPAPSTDPSTPALRITLMLTTGARHAYTISQKYLSSRKVTALDASGNFDPREMSGYKLKELIWTDWRSEWEARPRDPSSIRLIIMGRMIDDKASLKDLPFALPNSNVVHMTVKPADLLDDEAEGAGKTGSKGSIRAHNAGEESGAGCRCVIL